MTPKRQILVVEDNRLNREMLVEILSDRYTIFEAENGQEGLDILRQHNDSIALVLLDIMMPVMDGYAFLDKVKEYPELSIIPVIVMTQSDSIQDEVAALAHGATDFVPKPYQPEVVLHRVASLINLRETSAMVNYLKYDRLTGLYSKDYFYQKVRECLLENPEQDYCIVCSNIENFKLINDSFGVQEGDRLLKEVADITRNMVGSTGFCGRFSADRFLCFQRREQEQRDRENFGNAAVHQISSMLKKTVIRWGIYEITDRTIPVELMCDRALMAVNSIKGQYEQFFAVYDESLRSKQLREQAITNAMTSALKEEQVVVYFQPKYDLQSGCMVGAEALVRWNHPEWGFVSPGEFIPLFEKNGFIFQLDQYVWERTCIRLRSWRDKGYPSIPVSVNVSRADLYHANLVDTLLGLTQKYGIDPMYLHLEITESAYTENLVQITETVEKLQKNNFLIEMDDFGSGYSSLNMFSQMKLDILKLDMQFVQNETAKPANQSILNDIINMAHRMSLKVIAEGVEKKEQVNRLQAIGCDFVQGYYFAKPMPAGKFEQLLKEQGEHDVSKWCLLDERSVQRVLIADEDAEYRKRVHRVFDHEYQVLDASDTDSALEQIRFCEGKGLSALILSATLPGNGAAVILKAMRKNPTFWNVPILATLQTPGGDREEPIPLILETDDFLCKCHPMFDLRRRVAHLIDIAELKKREKGLQDEANRDPLTGLLNRRGLQSAINSLRVSDYPVAVCMFDLDNLKSINDTFGHNAGDQIIQAFSELIRQETRSNDVVCRYGGDEFVLLLRKITDKEVIMKRITHICRKFKDCLADEPFRVSCSAGIVLCEGEENLSAQFIERADQVMYHTKRENKGGCLWEDDVNQDYKKK